MDKERDLTADLAICEAATEGPWEVRYNDFVYANDVRIAEMYSGEDDDRFIAEARTGWPIAIKRAMAAEAEVTQLRQDVIEYGTLYQRHMETIREQAEEVDRLRNIIARLRCAECGDQLGDNWTKVDGEVLCAHCGGVAG